MAPTCQIAGFYMEQFGVQRANRQERGILKVLEAQSAQFSNYKKKSLLMTATIYKRHLHAKFHVSTSSGLAYIVRTDMKKKRVLKAPNFRIRKKVFLTAATQMQVAHTCQISSFCTEWFGVQRGSRREKAGLLRFLGCKAPNF